jgi:hypothetical protein
LQRGTVVQGPDKRARIQRVVYGESLTAARGSAEMTPAAEMPAAVKMRAAMTTAVMATAVMTAAVVTATAVAAMRHRIRWERQRCRHCGDVSKIP